jgi:hypothetical protein
MSAPPVLPVPVDVALDDDAIGAQRRALLAELAEERFGGLLTRSTREPYAKEVVAACHLREAATLARDVAEAERRRCARWPRPVPVPEVAS